MQDVFVYMLINRKEYDFKYSLKTYLYTIAKSRAFNYMKREKKVVNLEEVDFEYDTGENIEEQIFKREDINNLRKAIKKLKPEWQSAIYLTKIEGMQYKEVCKILDISLPQVKILVHRATKRLEELLRKEKNYDI